MLIISLCRGKIIPYVEPLRSSTCLWAVCAPASKLLHRAFFSFISLFRRCQGPYPYPPLLSDGRLDQDFLRFDLC